jgi:N-acetylglucosamine-6-sulfatase
VGLLGRRPGRGCARLFAATLASACVLAGLGVEARWSSASDGGPSAAGATRAPNFLLILVDDQARNSFEPKYMPQTFARIVDRGTFFENGLAAPPLCCPDRAGILTGQYPHDHGVFSNDPGYAELNHPEDTLPVWLQNAGYRTGFIGKFLNNYSAVAGSAPAPGFDTWFGFMGVPNYHRYEVSDDGQVRKYGLERDKYSTDVLTRRARRFVRESAGRRKPFFLWLAYNAPHGGVSRVPDCEFPSAADPPGRAALEAVGHVPVPHPPSFNEADVSDKPEAVRSRPLLGGVSISRLRHVWRCDLAAIAEVDKGVGRVMSELRSGGELRRTIVLYLSDNGFFFGEHRFAAGKSAVYEPALNVPYAVRVPPAYRPGSLRPDRQEVVTNQDVAPTLLHYASRYLGRVKACAAPGDCRRMDGRSLAPLLGGAGAWPADRGVLAEIDDSGDDYQAIRTRRYTYSELATGERELYDLGADPFELQNVADSPAYAQVQAELGLRLASLTRCSGVAGRDRPTPRPFCE